MLDRVSITVPALSQAAPFWDATMAALGVPCVVRRDDLLGYMAPAIDQTTTGTAI